MESKDETFASFSSYIDNSIRELYYQRGMVYIVYPIYAV